MIENKQAVENTVTDLGRRLIVQRVLMEISSYSELMTFEKTESIASWTLELVNNCFTVMS